MANNPIPVGITDRNRIHIDRPVEVAYWTKALGVSEAQLKAAVKAVGEMTADVKAYLEQRVS